MGHRIRTGLNQCIEVKKSNQNDKQVHAISSGKYWSSPELSGGGTAGQLLLMIVRTRFRRPFFSLLPFLSSFDRSPFGSSIFPSPLLRLVGAGASGRAASVGILLFSHTVCWTVCDYRTRTLSFCFLFRIFSSALVRAYFRCFASLSPPPCTPFLHPFLLVSEYRSYFLVSEYDISSVSFSF